MIAASACLLGYKCRYDGKTRKNIRFIRSMKSSEILPVCPEELGGLPTPRNAYSIIGGDGFDVLDKKAAVIDNTGNDNTEAFIKGAYHVLKLLQERRIDTCYLKSRSPSCGPSCESGREKASLNKNITCENKPDEITGVTAALLLRNNIQVIKVD